MRITQEANYALRIVLILRQNGQNRMSAADISKNACVSERFTLKIMNKLVNGGMIRSYKGANGGYVLEKDASEISLRDIIELIDGPIAISRCIDDSYTCTKEGNGKSECIMYRIFCKINAGVADRLARISIADITGENIDADEILGRLD